MQNKKEAVCTRLQHKHEAVVASHTGTGGKETQQDVLALLNVPAAQVSDTRNDAIENKKLVTKYSNSELNASYKK